MKKDKSTETPDDTKEEDIWGITNDQKEYQKWKDMTTRERVKSVFIVFSKIVLILASLYLFVCSLSVMGSSFQILAGKTAGTIFGQDSVLSNPIAGLIIGVLVTVLVQSSSTSTSIVTTMVGADIITVHHAIPIIMGANIGTSVTNTIVSLMQSLDVNQFRRAFAGATVHDIFNLLSVVILLPIEVASGFLEKMTKAIVDSLLKHYTSQIDPPDILKVITNPLTKKIVQVDKGVIRDVAQGKNVSDKSILKMDCHFENVTVSHQFNMSSLVDLTNATQTISPVALEEVCVRKGAFAYSPISDPAIGGILLCLSFFTLCICLVTLVKLLNSLLKGSVSNVIKKMINSDFPFPFAWLTGYFAILIGAGLTFIVQSSSVFTSTMTPLVGIGVISLKRMYPLTLGSNIGTTTTSLLAALTADPDRLSDTLQIAFCHFFFNIAGILIWYPIPFMRKIPIRGAKFLGRTTAKYRWFAVIYLFLVFFIIPSVFFGLSLIEPIWVLGGILIAIGIIVLFVVVVKILQAKRPHLLTPVLQDWKFLPIWLRSLEPYDRIIMKIFGRCQCCKQNEKTEEDSMEMGEKNKAFEE